MFQFQVKDQNFTINENKYGIEALVAYGMEEPHCFHLLFILNDCMNSRLCAIRTELSNELSLPKDQIVVVTKQQLAEQARKGDLYFWYMKKTCRILYSNSKFTQDLFRLQIPKPNMSFETKSVIQFIDNSMQLYRQKRLDCYTMLAILADGMGDIGEHICIRHGAIIFHKKNAVEKCFHFADVTIPFTYQQYTVLYKFWCHFKMREESELPRKVLVELAVKEWYDAFSKFATC